VLVGAAATAATAVLAAQTPPARLWRAEERTLITDLWRVTAVAATPALLYAATPNGLAVYDRAFRDLRDVLGPMDGYPTTPVTAMAADPNDDTAWLGAAGLWVSYDPRARRFESGPLPGSVAAVVLDRRDPSRGAFFRTSAGWYFVPRGALVAEPASGAPPADNRITELSAAELRARAPALDVVRARLERDDQLRSYPLTSATVAPVASDLFIGTAGNGVFRVDAMTYTADRYPPGLLGPMVGAVAVGQGLVCAGSSGRFASPRRGISCLREDLREASHYEGRGLAGLPGSAVRRLLIARRAMWAATDAGLLRVDRRSGEVRQLRTFDGLPSDDVRALAPAPDGLWVGTTQGLAVVGDSGGRDAVLAALPGAAVLALAARDDTLWIGTTLGLTVLRPGDQRPLAVTGHPGLRDPVVAVVVVGDTVVVATSGRLLLGIGAEWRVADPFGPALGRLVALAADRDGLWVAGDGGLAFARPLQGVWRSLTAPGDIPTPVAGLAVTRDHVWVATAQGLVRYLKRVLAGE
jgi:hypothetical protein